MVALLGTLLMKSSVITSSSTTHRIMILLFLFLICAPLSSIGFAFTSLPSRTTLRVSPSKPNSLVGYTSQSVGLFLSEDDADIDSPTVYTPADRPVLAAVDVIGLVIFALIGKSSHSADGSMDVMGVMSTAFPFVTAWLTTSPLTGVYSPDDRGGDTNLAASTAIKVAKGWALAVPLGIVLRGVLKGYVPPVPFIIVTMISTLIILAGIRLLFNVAENFFVELV